jgi:Muconolactone delta-isomerase
MSNDKKHDPDTIPPSALSRRTVIVGAGALSAATLMGGFGEALAQPPLSRASIGGEVANEFASNIQNQVGASPISKKENNKMQYLVQAKLVAGRPTTPEEGVAFIEQVIFPSLEMCKKLQDEKKILAGGPISGTIGIAMIVEVGSALELDELIESLPIWIRTETTVTPLTTFEGRIRAIRPRLDQLKANPHK